jgi:hypothetical protein
MNTPLEKPYYDLEQALGKLETEHNLIYKISDIFEYALLDKITLCASIFDWQDADEPFQSPGRKGVYTDSLFALNSDPIDRDMAIVGLLKYTLIKLLAISRTSLEPHKMYVTSRTFYIHPDTRINTGDGAENMFSLEKDYTIFLLRSGYEDHIGHVKISNDALKNFVLAHPVGDYANPPMAHSTISKEDNQDSKFDRQLEKALGRTDWDISKKRGEALKLIFKEAKKRNSKFDKMQISGTASNLSKALIKITRNQTWNLADPGKMFREIRDADASLKFHTTGSGGDPWQELFKDYFD